MRGKEQHQRGGRCFRYAGNSSALVSFQTAHSSSLKANASHYRAITLRQHLTALRFEQPVVPLVDSTGVRIATLTPAQRLVDIWPAFADVALELEPRSSSGPSAERQDRVDDRGEIRRWLCDRLRLWIRSAHDSRITTAFTAAAQAHGFVSPLGTSLPGPCVADALPGFYGVDDSVPPWPAATAERLAAIEPTRSTRSPASLPGPSRAARGARPMIETALSFASFVQVRDGGAGCERDVAN